MHRLSLLLTLVLVAMVGSSAAGCAPVYAGPPRYEMVAVGSPGPGFVWEPGHWVHYRRGNLWVRGHWRRY